MNSLIGYVLNDGIFATDEDHPESYRLEPNGRSRKN